MVSEQRVEALQVVARLSRDVGILARLVLELFDALERQRALDLSPDAYHLRRQIEEMMSED